MRKIFHKIHLWLSVPFGIFITLICFSGAMLVFEKEITEMCRPDIYFVKETKGNPLPLDCLMERVSATLPDSVSIKSVIIPQDKERTWQVSLSKPRRASLYVDPYTGEVTGRNGRLPFFDTMFRLHRWMMGSSSGFGKQLVGASTLVLVVILLSGILMWLTNRKKPLKKSLTISLKKGWPRFWHDLHVAGGIYATIFLLAIALTGLTWSFSWYRTGFYSLFGVETVADNHGRQETHEAQRGGHAPEAKPSHGRDSHERHHGHQKHGRDSVIAGHGKFTASPFANWQEVYETLAKSHPGYQQITLSDGSANVVPEGRRNLRAGDRFDFDKKSGKITGCIPYSGQDKSTHVRSATYTLHVGSWGGIITRIINFLAALLGATLPLTGYYLWIRRLKGGRHSKKS